MILETSHKREEKCDFVAMIPKLKVGTSVYFVSEGRQDLNKQSHYDSDRQPIKWIDYAFDGYLSSGSVHDKKRRKFHQS